MEPVTLNSLLKEHPEYGDLPIVVESPNGGYDWVGDDGAGMVYIDVAEGEPVLVFAPN